MTAEDTAEPNHAPAIIKGYFGAFHEFFGALHVIVGSFFKKEISE